MATFGSSAKRSCFGWQDASGFLHRFLGERDGRTYWRVDAGPQHHLFHMPAIRDTGGGDSATIYSHSDDGMITCFGEDPVAIENGNGGISYDYVGNEAWAGRSWGGGVFHMRRGLLFFDTSGIPAGASVAAASVFVTGRSKQADQYKLDTILVSYTGSQPGTTADDFKSVGTEAFATVAWDDFQTESYNQFAVNSAGLEYVIPGGTTKYALRAPYGGGYALAEYVVYYTSGGPSAQRPYLSVTYSLAPGMSVNIGGAWKQVTGAWVNVGGTWKQITGAWANVGGVWKQV